MSATRCPGLMPRRLRTRWASWWASRVSSSEYSGATMLATGRSGAGKASASALSCALAGHARLTTSSAKAPARRVMPGTTYPQFVQLVHECIRAPGTMIAGCHCRRRGAGDRPPYPRRTSAARRAPRALGRGLCPASWRRRRPYSTECPRRAPAAELAARRDNSRRPRTVRARGHIVHLPGPSRPLPPIPGTFAITATAGGSRGGITGSTSHRTHDKAPEDHRSAGHGGSPGSARPTRPPPATHDTGCPPAGRRAGRARESLRYCPSRP